MVQQAYGCKIILKLLELYTAEEVINIILTSISWLISTQMCLEILKNYSLAKGAIILFSTCLSQAQRNIKIKLSVSC
jgi:hypothetical protein